MNHSHLHCTWCAGGALKNFLCKLRLIFFSALDAGAPTAPLATPLCKLWLRILAINKSVNRFKKLIEQHINQLKTDFQNS